MTSILDPGFCCKKWKRILPEEEACVFSTLIQLLASIHTLIQLFTRRHTLIQLLTRLDDQITCYTHSMSHATASISGRCQSFVECQKRGSRVAISMSNVHASSFCVPSATFSDVLLQSQRSHSGNFNVQNSSSEFDGQGKCFCRLFCSRIKEANCPKLSNLTITICL